MILEGIIKELATKVHSLGFVSRAGALLYESNASSGGADGIITSAQVAPFVGNKLVDVSPHAGETGTCFFRANATRVTGQDYFMSTRENEVVFTCWINGDRVKADGTDIEEKIVQALRSYRVPIQQGSPVRMVEIEYLGDSAGESINRWGWENKTLRYSEPPHLLFQHRFRITYIVSNGCYSQTVQVVNPIC